MRVHLAVHRSLIYLLPLERLFVAVTARVSASDLLERLSLVCFDLYQKAAPREAGACRSASSISTTPASARSVNGRGRAPSSHNSSTSCDAGSAVIAFDIDFAEPDRTSPKIAAAFACQKRVGTEKAEELLAALPDPDQRLVEAMAEAPVVTGFILTDRGEARPPLPKAGFALVGTIRSVKLLSGGGFEFAGPRSCGSWRRIPEPICRLGPRRPPDSTDFAARQQALSVALRRDAPGRPRRVQLCWPWG